MAWNLAVGVSQTPTNPFPNDSIQPFHSFQPPGGGMKTRQGRSSLLLLARDSGMLRCSRFRGMRVNRVVLFDGKRRRRPNVPKKATLLTFCFFMIFLWFLRKTDLIP